MPIDIFLRRNFIASGIKCFIYFWILFNGSSAAHAVATVAPERASSVLVIISDRSAPTLVAGAHHLRETQPRTIIQIRTVSQLAELSDAQLQQLIDHSQALALLGVFGDPVERLLNRRFPQHQYRLVLHSDRRLLPLSVDTLGPLFQQDIPETVVGDRSAVSTAQNLARKQQQFPRYREWLQARAYWLNRSTSNARHLLTLLASRGQTIAPLEEVAALRFALHTKQSASWHSPQSLAAALSDKHPIVWLLDHETGDLAGEWALHQGYCSQLSVQRQNSVQCVSILAGWGPASVKAVATIKRILAEKNHPPSAIIALQDFVIGGGDGRERVDTLFAELNIPVIKGLRLNTWSAADYALSPQGIPRDSVHYRIAMPELQGSSQPQILALASDTTLDTVTGAKVSNSQPNAKAIAAQSRRLQQWLDLQSMANAEKRVAVVYYNHPPGRHNIGADNLNIPDSLLEILLALKAAGYHTGELPEDSEALLDQLQLRGVNLPEDAAALAAMSQHIATLDKAAYQRWFNTLPTTVQAEMVDGPLAALHQTITVAIDEALALDNASLRQALLKLLAQTMHNTCRDLHHALDGLRHKGRSRALDLLDQLEGEYQRLIDRAMAGEAADWQHSNVLRDALLAMQIEGIRGWGKAPGKVMVWNEQMLIPGLQFGHVFIGPQPPRGWEINEELLHANLSFPPPHQYLGFYHYIQSVFKADAVIHLGRHSTYEFLPRRSVGLSEEDYPSIVAGDLPGIYPYIVDGVGEGIQAKRRGLAVMVDHLTPPLAITELYDDLLQLRQLIESAEAASDETTRSRSVAALRNSIDQLGLRDELIASMDEELTVRGVGFDDIDEAFLLHEVGHYLTNIQESFMPLGLHTFGRDWSQQAIDTMLQSMGINENDNAEQVGNWRQDLSLSPGAEMQALLNGLNGRFIRPGKGNDPIRTPEALPTGRNFYALDGSLLPTRVGYDIGQQLANEVLAGKQTAIEGHRREARNKQGVILWASDAVRDEGAMIAFGMKLLGVRPVWNSRGIIKRLERMPLTRDQPQRLDVLFTTSGLFRDLYGEHLVLLDKASLLALDASADRIQRDFPALRLALKAALAPLGEWAEGGDETLETNLVASNWVRETRALLASSPGLDPALAGRQSSLRVFGDAPGAYGAGINRLVERSSAWQERSELAQVFIQRLGHAYGSELNGAASQDLFRRQLAGVSHTFLGRASNLYGLIDNNDAFDYLGGFNLAVETVSGSQPDSAVINHADNNHLRIDNLSQALLSELRGRFLNPQWIKPLMNEGYAGARTMGSEFIEYLWGWQVTSPDIISDQVWQEVKAVYVDDQLELGLDQFLAQGHQRHVQTNILAVMLVAIDKQFWQADETTIKQLAEQFAGNIIEQGIPGSGHTHANHPMYELVKTQLSAEQSAALEAVLARSRLQRSETTAAPAAHIQELTLDNTENTTATEPEVATEQAKVNSPIRNWLPWLLLVTGLLVCAGLWRGRRAL